MTAQYAIVDAGDRVLRVDQADEPPELDAGQTAEELPAGAVVQWPQGPGEVLLWRGGDLIVSQTLSLDELRAIRWATLKIARDAHEFGGFVWDGAAFDSDPASQGRIQGAVQLVLLAQGEPLSLDWTLADNTVRTLSSSDLVAVGMALAAHVEAQHATGRTLRQQLAEASTAAEINGTEWPT